MPIDAVIFDMDGVIIASEDYWWESRCEWVESLGKTWTDTDQRDCMGRNTVEWAQVMKDRLGLDTPLEEVIEQVRSRIVARLEARLPVLPGAVEAVHTAASKYPVALASGSPTIVIQRVMALTGLDRVFKVMIFGDDMARGKPHPDIYLETARLLGVDPTHCVGIEDSGNGIRSLKAAGMYAIAVPSPGFTLPPDILSMADMHLPSLESFSLDLLDSLASKTPKPA